MDVAGRPVLLETMGARSVHDTSGRSHCMNRSYQRPDGLQSPTEGSVSHLATLIGNQRLLVGFPLGIDLASLVIGATSVVAIEHSTDTVGR